MAWPRCSVLGVLAHEGGFGRVNDTVEVCAVEPVPGDAAALCAEESKSAWTCRALLLLHVWIV